MADENKLNIRLQVLGQDYPIKIDRKDDRKGQIKCQKVS